MGSFYDIIPWGSTCILGAYWHYMFYGDRKIIEDNYEAGQKYLAHECSMRNAEGFLNHGLGDWGHPENLLVRENVETAFLYADAKTMELFAKLLGKAQAAEALPLYWGMVPEENVADVVRAFRDTLEEKQALVSGEIGLPYMIQTARRYGMNDLICRYITRTQHPSYYAFVLDGETTLGEYWESNPRSHCHDMMGHIIEWFYNGLAGIEPVEPGFKTVKIHPYLPEGMNELECSYRSVQGIIRVRAVRKNGKIATEISVSEGMKIAAEEAASGSFFQYLLLS